MMAGRRKGFFDTDCFTLIELLVVIAIISVLAALLMPALKGAKFEADKTRGMNNLRQVGLAIQMYRNDYNDRPPADTNWTSSALELLWPYNVSNLCYCTQKSQPEPGYYITSNPTVSYGCIMCNINLMGGDLNVAGLNRPMSEVENPSTTFLIAHNFETATWSPSHFDEILNGSLDPNYAHPYNNKGLNFYFVDDHVEWIPYLGPNNSRWWNSHVPASSNPNWVYKSYQIYGP